MDALYSNLSRNIFSIIRNKNRFDESMKKYSFYGIELEYGAKKYAITDGPINFSGLEKISNEIEEIINQ